MFEKKEAKNIKVTVRFSESEKKIIDDFIEKNNYGNVSEFIRDLISNKFKK